MKFLVLLGCFALQFLIASTKILPSNFPLLCSKSDTNYNKCMENAFEKLGPHLLKGVKAINFPKLHPLVINTFSVNRTVNEFVSISAVLKNLQIYGFDKLRLDKFNLDHDTLEGELHLFIPLLDTKMEYSVIGKLFSVNLKNAGFFAGNASDIDLKFNFKLQKFDKLGVEYYKFENFEGKSTIGNGYIKLISKNPADQFAADVITTFFNENPKRTLDAVQPIYEESVTVFYKSLAEQFLSTIPANEFIPE